MLTNRHQSSGFILPMLIVFSIVLMAGGLVALQYITASTGSVQTQYYNAVAKEAADAGANQAISCIRNSTMTWSDSAPLKVNSDCSGTIQASQNDYLSRGNGGTWKSSFTVTSPNQQALSTDFTSTGTVSFYYAGSSTPTNTYIQTTKVNIPTKNVSDVRQIAQGLAVTKSEGGDGSNCAIANLSLYCWGRQDYGQSARGAIGSNQLTPLPSNTGSITNQRVYDLASGAYNGCALSDGYAHCWGRNNVGQLGIGTSNGTIYTPTKVGGDLASMYTQAISQGSSSDAVNGTQFGCAIASIDVYCWGANNYAQLGQVDYDCLPFPFSGCFGVRSKARYTTAFADATERYPKQVFGYSNRQFEDQSQMYNKPATSIANGAYGACLITNGRGYCWGNRFIPVPFNDAGNMIRSDGYKDGTLSGKIAINASNGESSSCMIADGGTANCWGRTPGDGGDHTLDGGNFVPRIVPNGSGSPINGVSIVSSNMRDDTGPQCINGDGKAYCWGGNTPSLYSPIYYDTGTEAVLSVGAGKTFSCIIANASSYCLGDNSNGQHGTNDTVAHATPTKTQGIGLTAGEAATNISVGGQHSCAVVNGYIYCWGKNDKGQLGVADTASRLQPSGIANITDLKGATAVSAGTSHTCGIINGAAYCWGDDSSGQIGDGGINTSSPIPIQINGALAGKSVTDIDAGKANTCAVADGKAYCWGDNSGGQIGNNTTGGYSTSPVAVQGLSGLAVTKITVGDKFACAIANTQLYCWGDNQFGTLGIGSNGAVKYPTAQKVNGFNNNVWTDVDAGSSSACGIADGIARCWGSNAQGQIGQNASGGLYNTPQAVMSNISVNSIANKSTREITVGANHACSISNGLEYCWGDNTNGKLGNGDTNQQNVSTPVIANAAILGSNYPYKIEVGDTSSCAIANAKITCWGAGDQGQLGVASSTSSQTSPVAWTSDYIREQRTLDLTNIIMF